MPRQIEKLRTPLDSEKITINLGVVDLGHVDLLVREGFYSNRTDVIRTAIRNLLDRHGETAQRAVRRQGLELGISRVDRVRLEAALAAGEMLDLRVLGLLTIAEDVSADLARAAIGSLTILGSLHASPAVKAALADRIA